LGLRDESWFLLTEDGLWRSACFLGTMLNGVRIYQDEASHGMLGGCTLIFTTEEQMDKVLHQSIVIMISFCYL